MSQMKAMTQIMELFRTSRLLYSGETDDCSETRMKISALREPFKAQELNSQEGPRKNNAIMLNQLDCLHDMIISSYNQGLIVQSPHMAGIVGEMAALSEGLRSLIRRKVNLERQLSPSKYSGSSSEGDDFYSSMKSDSNKEKV